MKTTAFLAALAAFLLAAPSASFAQASGSFSFGKPKAAAPADLVTVQAKGQGESVEAAKKDAIHNAIKMAVGELVDAKTLVENDELVEDKILTLSNAMVEKADYGDAKSVGDGLFEVPVTAVVKKGQLNKELKAIGITTGSVAGDSLAAELFSGKERIANAEKFFSERFKDFPQNVMEAVMLTKDDGAGNQVPDIGSDDKGHLYANVGVQVNMTNYAEWTAQLCELLDAVCSVKEEVVIPFKESTIGGIVYWGSSQEKGLDGERVAFAKRPDEKDWHLNNAATFVPVIVATPSAKGLNRKTWPASVYYVDASVFKALEKAIYSQVGRLSGSVQIVLKDEDGSPICSANSRDSRLGVGGGYSGVEFAPLCCALQREDRLNVDPPLQSAYVFITPVLKHNFSFGGREFSYSRETDPTLRFRLDLGEVSEDDLGAVTGYEVKVEFTKR